MAIAQHPVWLALPRDEKDQAKRAAGNLDDGLPAIEWDPSARLWFARPGCDIDRIAAWLPDPSRRTGGGNAEDQFLDALTEAGLIIKGKPIMNGSKQYVSTVENRSGDKKSGVYVGYTDGHAAGWFVNYQRSDEAIKWKSEGGDYDPVSRLHVRARARQVQEDSARERLKTQTAAASAAKRLYDKLPAADPTHPYLVRKGVPPTPDLRQTNNGALVVPFFSAREEFRTLQYITAEGGKTLFKDGPKQGAFLVVGGPLDPGKPILYAEGYATARSLNLALGVPVVMTIDAGNMVVVAQALHAAYPGRQHLFMADYDHAKSTNKGLLKATEAAKHVGGQVLYPQFTDAEKQAGLTDFNDLHHSRGLAALSAQVLPTVLMLQEARAMADDKDALTPPLPDARASHTADVQDDASAALFELRPDEGAVSEVAARPEASGQPSAEGDAASGVPDQMPEPVPTRSVEVPGEQLNQAADSEAGIPAPGAQSVETTEVASAAQQDEGTAADPVAEKIQSQTESVAAETPEVASRNEAAAMQEVEVRSSVSAPEPAKVAEAVVQSAASEPQPQTFSTLSTMAGWGMPGWIPGEMSATINSTSFRSSPESFAARPPVTDVPSEQPAAAVAPVAAEPVLSEVQRQQLEAEWSSLQRQALANRDALAINFGAKLIEAFKEREQTLKADDSQALAKGPLTSRLMQTVGLRKSKNAEAIASIQDGLKAFVPGKGGEESAFDTAREAFNTRALKAIHAGQAVDEFSPWGSRDAYVQAQAQLRLTASGELLGRAPLQPQNDIDLATRTRWVVDSVAKGQLSAQYLGTLVLEEATRLPWVQPEPVVQAAKPETAEVQPQTEGPSVTQAPVDSPAEEPPASSANLEPAPDRGPGLGAGEPAASSSAAEQEVDGIIVGPRRPTDATDPDLPNAARIDMDALLTRLTCEPQGDRALLFKLDGEPAFIDRGTRLDMAPGASQDEEKVLAALLTAARFHSGRIELTGSDAFKAKAIELIVRHELQVTMKNPIQQLQLDEARKAQNMTPAPKDSITGDMPTAYRPHAAEVAPVPTTEASPSVAQPQSTAAAEVPVMPSPSAVAAMPPEPLAPVFASPAPSAPTVVDLPGKRRLGAEVHQTAEAAKDGVKGKVLDCGKAPFHFKEGEDETAFITLRTNTGIETYWGKELAGLLRETRVQPGSVVELKWLGKAPVTVQVPVKNSEGATLRYEPKDTHRNRWDLVPLSHPAVRTGQDEGVKLAAYDARRFAVVQQALTDRLQLPLQLPESPQGGLFWLLPNGQGSAKAGDELTAPRPQPDPQNVGQPVVSSWSPDGTLDLALVRGDGDYLQGVVRWQEQYHPVIVSLPGREEAPPMVFNLVTPTGLVPIGTGNGINRAEGQAVSREHIAFKLEGEGAVRIGQLEDPARLPPKLHALMGFDERYRPDANLPKSQPAAAPQAQLSPQRPA